MPPPGIAFDAILSMVTTAPSCSSLMPTASSGMPSPRKPEAALTCLDSSDQVNR